MNLELINDMVIHYLKKLERTAAKLALWKGMRDITEKEMEDKEDGKPEQDRNRNEK